MSFQFVKFVGLTSDQLGALAKFLHQEENYGNMRMALQLPDGTGQTYQGLYDFQHVILKEAKLNDDELFTAHCSIAHYYEPADKPVTKRGWHWVIFGESTPRPVPRSVIINLYQTLGLFPQEREDEYPDRCGGILHSEGQ